MPWKRRSNGVTRYEYIHGIKGLEKEIDLPWKKTVYSAIPIIRLKASKVSDFYSLDTDFKELEASLNISSHVDITYVSVRPLQPVELAPKDFRDLLDSFIMTPRQNKAAEMIWFRYEDVNEDKMYGLGPLRGELGSLTPVMNSIIGDMPVVRTGNYPKEFPKVNFVREEEFPKEYRAFFSDVSSEIVKSGSVMMDFGAMMEMIKRAAEKN